MKRVVNVITIIALLSVMLGISMIDSENTLIPVLVMTPGSLWMILRVAITEVFK